MSLSFRNIRKSTPGGVKLFDIERFDISEGACIVLSGRNGAGKSTLLKILAGLEEPDAALVSFDDDPPQDWKSTRRRLRREAVYLHQQACMLDRSVDANIAYGLRLAGMPRKEVTSRVQQALQWAGLSHLAGRNALELSGGEKQRVALTRARVLSPKLLLLDEPLSGLDRGAREQTILLIKRLREEGVSSVITSHEPHISRLLGDEHRHLCKSGPCRDTIVDAFIFKRGIEHG